MLNGRRDFHSVSGNPSRFSKDFRSIKPDYEWKDRIGSFRKTLAWLICAPLAYPLGYSLKGNQLLTSKIAPHAQDE
jgi:hypothetical protein